MKLVTFKVFVSGLLTVSLCAGCTLFSAQRKWERTAGGLEPGTHSSLVFAQLPPTSAVLDRRSPGAGGPVTYMVDKDFIVKMIFDRDDTLAYPVLVEKLRDKRNVKRSDSRPSIRYSDADTGKKSSNK